jgi:hypothetical protein
LYQLVKFRVDPRKGGIVACGIGYQLLKPYDRFHLFAYHQYATIRQSILEPLQIYTVGLLFLFFCNLNIIITATPHSISAGTASWKNHAIPPAIAKVIPKIPMTCLCLTKLHYIN